jgi:uncharacterized protein (UPF0261 family)
MKTIAVMGTFDTKGREHAFVAEMIRARGHRVVMVDVGILEDPPFAPDVTRREVAAAAGADLAALAAARDRGAAVLAMSRGAPVVLAKLAAAGKVDGVISLGGGGGTAIATAAMRALPIGFPKVMVSTLASGNVAPYVGVADVVMFPSVVDVAGLNRISRMVLTRAAGAICGMVESTSFSRDPKGSATETEKPLIVASQFGNTTPCVDRARALLEANGYEVVVFAATGVGGRTMEALIESGIVAGVLDVTTTEWADELVGGVLTAGPGRLEAAARKGVPAVVSTGCLDMVNFGPPDSIPGKFRGRTFYAHNPQITLMRTTADENRELGRVIAGKLNRSVGPVSVVIPLRGASMIGAPGQPFDDPAADAALRDALRAGLRGDIPVIEVDCNVNDAAFAEACVGELLANVARAGR